jgi:hypothetical protein
VVEVGAQPDRYLHGIGGQVSHECEEPFPLCGVAVGVQPFELVGHDNQPDARSGTVNRCRQFLRGRCGHFQRQEHSVPGQAVQQFSVRLALIRR